MEYHEEPTNRTPVPPKEKILEESKEESELSPIKPLEDIQIKRLEEPENPFEDQT